MGLPLHVFEQRYREMMARVLDGDRTFGVVAIRAGAEVGIQAETFEVGSLAVVEELARFEDGRYAMIVRGTNRFRIDHRLPDDPYPQGETALLADEEGDGAAEAMTAAAAAFTQYLSAAGSSAGPLPPDPIGCSYAIASALRLPVVELQSLLEEPTAATRLRAEAELASREAALLERFGPAIVRPDIRPSGN
jgi:Lon protease-like protein